jgi:protein-S-isoprenylcysteine O-methyltransferase Ste14
MNSWLTILLALLLFVFFDIKSRREEKALSAKFSAYAAYQQRVRKLLPYLY